MAKGVLGNDPFKRGAAVRPVEKAEAPVESTPAAAPARTSTSSTAASRKPARGKNAAQQTPRAETPATPAKGASSSAARPAASRRSESGRVETASGKAKAKPAQAPAPSRTRKASAGPRGRGKELRALDVVPEETVEEHLSAAKVIREPIEAVETELRARAALAPLDREEAAASEEPVEEHAPARHGAIAPAAEAVDAGATSGTAEVRSTSAPAARTSAGEAGDEGDASDLGDAAASGGARRHDTAPRTPADGLRSSAGDEAPSARATTSDARVAATPTPPAAATATFEPQRDATASSDASAREVSGGSPSALLERAATALAIGRSLVSQATQAPALSRVLETATGVFRAIQTGLGTAGSASLDDYGKDLALSQQLRTVSDFVYHRYWRVQVEGADKVPGGPAILVANHSGAVPFDGPVLYSALKRERPELNEARWLVEDQVFHAPFLGTLLNRLGAVRACPENALRLLDERRPVIVFPEGVQGISKPFRERYKLMRFGRGGFVKLAIRTRTPIIPVAIVGAEEAMPLLGTLPGKMFGVPYVPITSPIPLPAKWTVRFGDPISVDEFPPSAQEDLILVHRLNERTRESIQGMIDAVLKSREGVFA